MQDHPSTGLKPTYHTGRTAPLFKPSAPRNNASFSPINILRPMASYLRAHATTTTTTPTSLQGQKHREQPIASGSKDQIPPTAYCNGQPASMTDELYPVASVDHITAGHHQNLTTFSTPKVPFLNRKLDRSRSHRATPGIHEEPRTESEVSPSWPYLPGTTGANVSKFWTATLRTRTISSKSGSGYSQEELPAGDSLPVSSSQGTRARSDDSLESGVSTQRVVGRGGSGSRPRVVIAEDQIPTFDILARKGSLCPDQQPALRPSGRGGFASRPQPLAPPPPLVLPNLLSSNHSGQLRSLVGSERDQPQAEPLFVRPGGRGGAGSRSKISTKKSHTGANHTSSQSSSLLARLQIRKLRSQLQHEQQELKGKSPETGYGIHPLRDSMAYMITNGSSSTLSTIQFNTDPQPRPHFFPHKESGHTESVCSHITLTTLASEDMSWTPTNTFSSANSDCVSSTSVNETPDDESQLDTYYIEGGEELQETRPTTPSYHHQRTLDKLTRTLGEAPTTLLGPREQAGSKLAIKTAITSSRGKSKEARRANISLSVSSMFMRPRRGSTASESTFASASDDLHLSNRPRRSDAVSESWGLARDSYSTSPGSPMIFSAPSPSQERRQSQLSFPHMLGLDEDVDEGGEGGASVSADADAGPVTLTGKLPNSDSYEAISPLPSPVLSRSKSVTLSRSSMRRLQWQTSPLQPASMSALDAGQHLMPDEPSSPVQALPPQPHPKWLFPPDDSSDNFDCTATAFSTTLKRQRHETAISLESNEQGWTGEWNDDLQEVIRGLRSLH